MKNSCFFFLIFTAIISCTKKQERKTIRFTTVDLSYSDGWHSFYSMNIDSAANVFLKTVTNRSEPLYYKGKLTDTIMADVIRLTDSIIKTTYDTIYPARCYDCPFYKICITSKEKKQTIFSMGLGNNKELDSLVYLCTRISKTNTFKKTEDQFHFESFEHFLPKPVRDTVQFTPPETN